MKRAIFIAAASAWYLANLSAAHPAHAADLERVLQAERLERRAAYLRRTRDDDRDALDHIEWKDAAEAASLARFGLRTTLPPVEASVMRTASEESAFIYRRKDQPKGPMDGFGYSWLEDRLAQTGLKRPALLDRAAPRDGPSFAYEALNLVDGRRSVHDIAEYLSVTIAPVPVAEVADYLAMLSELGLLERR